MFHAFIVYFDMRLLSNRLSVYLAANVRMLSVADAALLPSVTNMLKLLKQGAEKSCQPIRISVNARA